MIPSKLDLLVWRGTTFELELVSQVKKYTYDPAIHVGAADLKRTHAENLEKYGYVWEYVDFATLYPQATLTVMKAYNQNSIEPREPILELSAEQGSIELTSNSVKIGMNADETQDIEFDKGTYKLMLITAQNKVDGLIYGTMHVKGER